MSDLTERKRIEQLETENERLQNWINDLQAGMYINCVYCGHNYGPDDEVPATMAEVLKEHIAMCPKHPMSGQRQRIEQLEAAIKEATRGYDFDCYCNPVSVCCERIGKLIPL